MSKQPVFDIFSTQPGMLPYRAMIRYTGFLTCCFSAIIITTAIIPTL
ncbi:hypothetical protein GXP67_32325 [Rhodocytophaga rosea]|uniref:Uncharacterized protein n=1 Tax=Rhodocytophaga rosea TaxID=2704465 RepID=A0A6C0GSC2_9BACT|nr:hypothetical protein [Rhodocytophaga rosea]QHT71005.1 hypothetical protein GXP67_32325 [Rhodocytophaga rosea]